MNIFVGKLHPGTKEEELKELFSQYGIVMSANIIMDRTTHKSKGFGFVDMYDREDGERAIAELDGFMLRGRMIAVSEARPSEERYGR